MKWLGLVTFTVLVALSVQESSSSVKDAGSPLKCYVCNENTDERCRDPFKFDSNLIQDCSSDDVACRKMAQTGRSNLIVLDFQL